MTLVYSNRIVFGFTVICQQPDNETLADPDYYLSDSLNVAWMFTATAIGMIFGPMPLSLTQGCDTRWLIVGYGAISIVSVLFYPLADSIGLWPALICRFLGGFSQGSQLHFSNDIVLRWTPKAEMSLFFSIMLAASQIGPLFTMILGGEMCTTSCLGWKATYYVLAFFTFISTVSFRLLLHGRRFDEQTHKEPQCKTLGGVPYKSLLTDVTIWTSLIMFSGYYVGMIVYQQYSPTFIKQVLNYSIRETGYFSAIPMIAAIVIKVGLGKLIDFGFGMSDKWRLALPLVFLEAPSAAALFLTGYMDDRRLALGFNMLFASLHFFVPVICSRTIQIRAGQYSHFAMNINMIVAGIAQIIIPIGVHTAVPDNTRQQWSHVFYFIAVLICLTSISYVFLTNARPAKWTKSTSKVLPA
ncbi:unnamed protein product [Caenorhabditis auriculariae]|uniref:Major facilitator superfamily (MFS) profile domain-containing protein n=1 Tax=Caenorhabditis auriculariae TaxID=2777116 RepID=A0A8S1HRD2_9PELO|nr:unnamed protein product [Caenorhabditis auriculariae]